MGEGGAFDLALFSLALRLHVDIDDVRCWPYRKINEWLAYFDAKERLRERDGR